MQNISTRVLQLEYESIVQYLAMVRRRPEPSSNRTPGPTHCVQSSWLAQVVQCSQSSPQSHCTTLMFMSSLLLMSYILNSVPLATCHYPIPPGSPLAKDNCQLVLKPQVLTETL